MCKPLLDINFHLYLVYFPYRYLFRCIPVLRAFSFFAYETSSNTDLFALIQSFTPAKPSSFATTRSHLCQSYSFSSHFIVSFAVVAVAIPVYTHILCAPKKSEPHPSRPAGRLSSLPPHTWSCPAPMAAKYSAKHRKLYRTKRAHANPSIVILDVLPHKHCVLVRYSCALGGGHCVRLSRALWVINHI